MNTCGYCHHETRNRKPNPQGEIECDPCRTARIYYDSLTPEERRAEHEAAARYADESDGL